MIFDIFSEGVALKCEQNISKNFDFSLFFLFLANFVERAVDAFKAEGRLFLSFKFTLL